MSFRVRRYAEPAAFRRRAEPWLLRWEAEHNLLLGILHTLEVTPDLFDPPVYLAVVERPVEGDGEGEIVGCVFRTPPFKLGLTRMPAAALPAVAADVAEVYRSLPAVTGPPEASRAFAAAWHERTGVVPHEGMRQRIFRLERVAEHLDPAPGALRAAAFGDLPLLTAWLEAFREEAGVQGPAAERVARNRIEREALYLWEDAEPVCMVGYSGESPNGRRVGPVYTPPSLRGRGYASAAVAALSRRTLAAGKRFCFLYTDLANPTSNRIYARIGYVPVTDVLDVRFDGA